MSTSEPPGPPDPFRKEPSGADPQQPPPYGQPPGGQQPPSGQPYGGQPPQGGQPYGQSPYGQMPPPPGEYGGHNAGPTLGGSGRRFVARVIDGIIYFAIGAVISLAFVGTDTGDVDFGKQAGAGAVTAVVYFLYEGFMLNRGGQTLGKMALGLKVVRVADGGPIQGSPAWTRAAVFSLPVVVPCVGFVFWVVDVLWHTWDQPWQQCLHDKAAKTTVIRV